MPVKTMLDFAMEYGARGWKIFPLFYVLRGGRCSCGSAKCSREGKHPITKNGLHDATSDANIIRKWWTDSPYANIGLATGHGGITVMDIDVSDVYKKGEFVRKKQGAKNLADLETTYLAKVVM